MISLWLERLGSLLLRVVLPATAAVLSVVFVVVGLYYLSADAEDTVTWVQLLAGGALLLGLSVAAFFVARRKPTTRFMNQDDDLGTPE